MGREYEPPSLAALDQLDEAITRRKQDLAAAEARQVELEGELADEDNDASLCAPGADERATRLRAKLAAARRDTEQCRAAEQKAESRRAAAVREREEALALERRRSVPRLTREYLNLALRTEQLAAELGAAMNGLADTGGALGEAIGSSEARRVLGLSATAERLKHCLVNCFNRQDNRPEAAREVLGNSAPFRWFRYEYAEASPLCRTRLSAATQEAVDSVVTIYGTEEEALAAQSRLDPIGLSVHVIPEPERLGIERLWHLVRARLRGAAARRLAKAVAP